MQRIFGRIAAISLVALFIVFFSFSASSRASAEDRIAQAIESGKVVALPGTVHPLAQARYDQGAVDGSLKLRGMSLDFTTTASQQAALAALIKAQQDPSSPSYRKWLTPQEYAEQFGMSQGDIEKVSSWLQSQGFTVDKVADSRNAIWFSGTAALAEAAFHTAIHKYSVNGEVHFANSGAVSIPSALAGSVNHVGGLNDFKLKPMIVRPVNALKNGATPDFTSGQSGNHFLAPGDFSVIYDMNPLYTAGFTGAGVTIGVIGQTEIVQADITNFRTAAGLPPYVTTGSGPTFTSFLIPTSADPGLSGDDLGEADLDLEWAGGVATNSNIVFVTSTNVFDSLQYAIANQINGLTIPVLTLSYGGCEAAFNASGIASLEASLQQANVQGQTFINSSGDSGAAACDSDSNQSATQGLAVAYPASSQYTTGVGGTEFMGDGSTSSPQTGAGTYWAANGSNDLITSAKSYIPEMTWNDTLFNVTPPNNGGLSSGGGGVSILFPKPSWQNGVPGIPADSHRDVPDVSLDASADHDPYLYCTQIVLVSNAGTGALSSSCGSGFRISDPGFSDDQSLTIAGGTSFAAPAFAGLLAVVEQKLGTQLGNINPALYTLAANSTVYASAFHDITVGNNDVPCTTGSANCPTGSNPMIGYSAGTGYDQVTGLGSVDGNELALAFATVETKAGTTTAFATNPTAPVVGQSVTLNATISPNNDSTTLPTGTVTFTVDGVVLTPVPVTDGIATTTTDFSTGGTHTVVAAYSGDTNYFASTTTSTISVSAVGATTTTTLSTGGQTSVALNQGTITLTATVASAVPGTIAGQVEFTVGTVMLAPVQVTSGASGTATASVTVSATAANGFTAGTTSITATYGGDSAYGASTSAPVSITVNNPALTMTVANMTISGSGPGNTGTSAIVVTSIQGYAGTVNLTATATTLNASYTITPTSLAIADGKTGTASISIETIASSIKKGVGGNLQHATPASNNRVIAGAAAAFGCIFLLGIPGFRKRRWPMLAMLLLLGGLGAGFGCGGGGGSSGASPKGTYTVTVIAADSANAAITVSTNFTVTIQ